MNLKNILMSLVFIQIFTINIYSKQLEYNYTNKVNINIYAQEINKYNINEECIICDIDCSISLDELELNEKKEEEYKKIAHNIVKNSQKCNINIESNSNIYTPSQTTYQLKTIRECIENINNKKLTLINQEKEKYEYLFNKKIPKITNNLKSNINIDLKLSNSIDSNNITNIVYIKNSNDSLNIDDNRYIHINPTIKLDNNIEYIVDDENIIKNSYLVIKSTINSINQEEKNIKLEEFLNQNSQTKKVYIHMLYNKSLKNSNIGTSNITLNIYLENNSSFNNINNTKTYLLKTKNIRLNILEDNKVYYSNQNIIYENQIYKLLNNTNNTKIVKIPNKISSIWNILNINSTILFKNEDNNIQNCKILDDYYIQTLTTQCLISLNEKIINFKDILNKFFSSKNNESIYQIDIPYKKQDIFNDDYDSTKPIIVDFTSNNPFESTFNSTKLLQIDNLDSLTNSNINQLTQINGNKYNYSTTVLAGSVAGISGCQVITLPLKSSGVGLLAGLLGDISCGLIGGISGYIAGDIAQSKLNHSKNKLEQKENLYNIQTNINLDSNTTNKKISHNIYDQLLHIAYKNSNRLSLNKINGYKIIQLKSSSQLDSEVCKYIDDIEKNSTSKNRILGGGSHKSLINKICTRINNNNNKNIFYRLKDNIYRFDINDYNSKFNIEKLNKNQNYNIYSGIINYEYINKIYDQATNSLNDITDNSIINSNSFLEENDYQPFSNYNLIEERFGLRLINENNLNIFRDTSGHDYIAADVYFGSENQVYNNSQLNTLITEFTLGNYPMAMLNIAYNNWHWISINLRRDPINNNTITLTIADSLENGAQERRDEINQYITNIINNTNNISQNLIHINYNTFESTKQNIYDNNCRIFAVENTISMFNGLTTSTFTNEQASNIREEINSIIFKNEYKNSLKRDINTSTILKIKLDQLINSKDKYKNIKYHFNQINTQHPTTNTNIYHALLKRLYQILNQKNSNEKDLKLIISKLKLLENELLPLDIKELIQDIKNYLIKELYSNNIIEKKIIEEKIIKAINNQIFLQNIVTTKEELKEALLKEKILKIDSQNQSKIYSWRGIDADGNNKNFIANILGNIKGLTLKEIYNSLNIEDETFFDGYQSRISYEDKKSVLGVESQLKYLEDYGIKNINNFEDLINEDIFNKSYKEFIKLLDNTKYEENTNNILDFILRFTLSNYTKSLGTIMSDFTDDSNKAIQTITRLRFIQLAVIKYLNIDQKNLNPHLIQLLCEDESSLQNVSPLFQNIFESLSNIYKKYINITNLNRILFINNILFISPFYGPSDTQAVMGGIAPVKLFKSSLEVRKSFSNFKNINKLNNKNIIVNYGRGNGFLRGMGFMIPNDAMTNQGLSSSVISESNEESSFMNSLQQDGIDDINKIDQILNDINTAVGITQGINSMHMKFWNIQNGILVNEYNNILQKDSNGILNNLFSKEIMTPAGTRGVGGKDFDIIKYQSLRAIPKSFVRVTSGLVPFVRYFENWSTDQNGVIDYLNTPFGSATLISELYGYLLIDFYRARILGFSEDSINEVVKYVENILRQFSQDETISISSKTTQNEIYNIIIKLIKNKIIPIIKEDNDIILNRWEAFMAISENINQDSNFLTNEIIINNILLSNNLFTNEEVQKRNLQKLAWLITKLTDYNIPIMPLFLPK